MPLTTFSPITTAKSTEVNGNFSLCVLTDTSRTISVTHTWSASQTFTGGWTAAAACSISTGGLTVSASGITVTGNSTITGTLGGVTTLTCTTVTATNLGGTLSTAAQPNVTSVGALSSLTVSGAVSTGALSATTGTFSGRIAGLDIADVASGNSEYGGALTLKRSTPGDFVASFTSYSATGKGLRVYTAGGATGRTALEITTSFGISFLVDGNGIVCAGTPTSLVGAGLGDIVLPNVKSIRGANAAGTASRALVQLSGGDKVAIDTDALGATFGAGAVFSGALSGITTLAATTVTANLTGNVTGNCSGTAATVTTAAQPSITSVGTLTSLTLSGAVSGITTLAGTGAISGFTSLALSAGITGVTTISMSSTLTMTAAASRIIPGATSLSHRNSANSADNVLIADNGDTTIRGNIQMTAGTGLLGTSGHQLLSATYAAGYTAMTGSSDAATSYATSTVTLAQLAGRVMAIQASLTTHGLIGA